MMMVRMTSAVLSLAGSLALILGLLSWAGVAAQFLAMHMLLGLLAVAALWVIGVAQALTEGGSWRLAACALIAGALTILVGLYQTSIMLGAYHWVIQVIHLLLGLLTIGLGHMAAARNRRNERAADDRRWRAEN